MLEIDLLKTPTQQDQDMSTRTHPFLVYDREQLLAEARPRLLRLARLRGVAPDALDDVVQETMLVAWRQLERLGSPEHFQRWIDEICRNICQRHMRTHYRDASRQIPLLDSSLSYDADAVEEVFITNGSDEQFLDPAELLSRQDLTVLLDRALGSLSETAREAVEMYYLLELPQREAAVRLGLSISALETRLHRARRQLRQILSGALRDEAASLGLPLDEEPAMGWRETRQWCHLCGQRRLHGTFESASDGHAYLRMRCPECSRRFGFDIVSGRGLAPLERASSFQPALKRTMRTVSQQLMQALTTGDVPCKHCGRPVPVQVSGPKGGLSLAPGQPQFWVGSQCPHCGGTNGGWSADDLVYWSHPAIQRFMQQHPRWLNEPDMPIEYAGQAAIRFRLSDMVSAARLTVITHRQSLQILAIFQE